MFIKNFFNLSFMFIVELRIMVRGMECFERLDLDFECILRLGRNGINFI